MNKTNSVRILIVEDEAVIAADIQELLQEMGYSTLGPCASAEAALDLLKSETPSLVMMDIRLKGEMDGIEAAEIIRDEHSIPLIFVTAHADEATLERAKVTEPYGYVLKPFKELELRAAVELALHRAGPSSRGKAAAEGPDADDGAASAETDPRAVKALEALEFFADAPKKDIARIAAGSRIVELSQGSFLNSEGDEANSGFLVLEGRIAMVKSSVSGKELIVELLAPGDPFGLMLAISPEPYAAAVKAQTKTTILRISKHKILRFLDAHPEISRAFLEQVFQRLRNSHDISRALAHDRVEVRIAASLLSLAPKFARNNGSAPEIPMTRQEIADLVGSTPETVIRVTKDMEREGILNLEQSGRIQLVDVERLSSIAEDM